MRRIGACARISSRATTTWARVERHAAEHPLPLDDGRGGRGHGMTKHYSMHSWRIYLACALLQAGASNGTIQAMLRWRSDEAVKIYGRINDDSYADWLAKAAVAPVSSIRSRRFRTPSTRHRTRERGSRPSSTILADRSGEGGLRRATGNHENYHRVHAQHEKDMLSHATSLRRCPRWTPTSRWPPSSIRQPTWPRRPRG